MADDANPALRAEIEAALAEAAPGYGGLLDLQNIKASREFLAFVGELLTVRTRRGDLLEAVIARLDAVDVAMEALRADGYPGYDKPAVSPEMMEEIKQQQAEIEAAFSLLGSDLVTPNDPVAMQSIVDDITTNKETMAAAVSGILVPRKP